LPEIEYTTNKAVYHTDKIFQLQQDNMIAPTEIQVDLEAFCNDNCSFCSYRKEDGYNAENMLPLIGGKSSTDNKPIGKPSADSRIPDDVVLRIPEMMVEAGIKAIEVTGGGEPTMHPKFDELISLLGKADREIGLVTNGSLLNDDRIDLIVKNCLWVRISMDSATPQTHKTIHRTPGYSFEKRMEAIKKIAHLKDDGLTLGISFIITPENLPELADAAKLFSEIKGINHLRFSWMYDMQGTAGLTPDQIIDAKQNLDSLIEEYDRDDFKIFYEKDRIEHYTAPNEFSKCYYQKFVWAIGADSKVYPCCIMKYHPNFANGDISKSTLKELINNMTTLARQNGVQPSKCFPCWLRNRNQQIANAVERPKHHNFI
jgi:MoaA/NifB/PqqE/SkfB family radical SAM enzyme